MSVHTTPKGNKYRVSHVKNLLWTEERKRRAIEEAGAYFDNGGEGKLTLDYERWSATKLNSRQQDKEKS